jgi:hypothetical protein
MPEVKPRRKLSEEAVVLAESFEFVRHRQVLYMPVDAETGDWSVVPDPHRTMWVPLSREDLQRRALEQFDTLFESPASLESFAFMVGQCSIQHTEAVDSVLVRTDDGLRRLGSDGLLVEPDGEFVPNTLRPRLNTDSDRKVEVLSRITDWLGGEPEEAVALLRHFATTLAPGWSAVKYVLLLGSGRNGKSLLMHMLQGVFGRENCSNVTRQDIADKSPAVLDLNGKLLNLVFDGQAAYLKDSGMEKSLIAGEAVGVRRLYTSELTPVQTSALFVEGLNKEPKSSDKSSALQARIIRFWFPNVYPLDQAFWDRMMAEDNVGALLSLMIDNYVQPHEASVMLAPSRAAIDLQLDHMYENSVGLQFVKHLEDDHPLTSDALLDMEVEELVSRFQSWRVKLNDLQPWPEPEVLTVFRTVVDIGRKSVRRGGAPRKVRVVTAFKQETEMFVERMRREANDDADTVVAE